MHSSAPKHNTRPLKLNGQDQQGPLWLAAKHSYAFCSNHSTLHHTRSLLAAPKDMQPTQPADRPTDQQQPLTGDTSRSDVQHRSRQPNCPTLSTLRATAAGWGCTAAQHNMLKGHSVDDWLCSGSGAKRHAPGSKNKGSMACHRRLPRQQARLPTLAVGTRICTSSKELYRAQQQTHKCACTWGQHHRQRARTIDTHTIVVIRAAAHSAWFIQQC